MIGEPLLASSAVRIALGGALLAVFFIAEEARPLRTPRQPKLERWYRNLGIIAVGAVALAFTYRPVVLRAIAISESWQFGLLRWWPLPGWVASAVAIVLFDYTLWIWHVLNHRLPFLWRFHAAHHVDLDLDASTAIRFHFGELLLSVPFRALQVLVIGADVPNLFLYETLLLIFTEFHHSNVRLDPAFERRLGVFIITPRLHGIHHSIVAREVNSNFGTLFTFWDRLHRRLLRDIPQDGIRIGIAEILDPERLGLLQSMLLPFRTHRPELTPRPWR